MCLIAILFQALCTMPSNLRLHDKYVKQLFQQCESATPLLSAGVRDHLQTHCPSFNLHQFKGQSWLKRGPSSTFICFPCQSAGHTVSFNADLRTDNLKRHGRCHRHTCAVAKMLELPMPTYPGITRENIQRSKRRRKARPVSRSDFKTLLKHLKTGGSCMEGTAYMSRHKAIRAMYPVLFLDIRLLHNFNACVLYLPHTYVLHLMHPSNSKRLHLKYYD